MLLGAGFSPKLLPKYRYRPKPARLALVLRL